jgi:8-oxo-dGTP pyrophosphatase MutT (NUDIX family)
VACVTNDDDEARIAWLADGNATQARKRIAAKGVIRHEDGRFLLVNPSYKDHWDLAGGMAEANESPSAALVREVAEELGIEVRVNRLLVVDWIGPHGPWDDQIIFVFDTEALTGDVVANLKITDNEISDFAFFSMEDARRHLRDDMAVRLERAARAMETNRAHYTESHNPGERS